jgi:hopene-associated glycosyltransferase HpnB
MAHNGAVLAWTVLGGFSFVIWSCLAVGRGGFWRTTVRLPPDDHAPAPASWPDVVAIVPARDEAALLPVTLPTVLGQHYPGRLRVIVVDDQSTDGTAEVARAAGADVLAGDGPPPAWAGKVAAMAAGVAAAGTPEYLLFTDADIRYPPAVLAGLVRAAQAGRLDVVSQMVRLRAGTRWERLVVPAFVYFFAQLYPFARVNRPHRRTAAAAGGCMLVRRAALVEAGGLAAIAGATIDDVALGRLVKHRPGGGRIWLGLSADIESVRPYPALADLWRMVSRSAYTQLRYSPWLLAGTVVGLLLTYVLPPVATLAALLARAPLPAAFGLAAWLIMAATYLPMLRFYGQRGWSAPVLPAVALLYLAMTIDSARQYRRGPGAAWKGRTAPAPPAGSADAR